MTYEEAQAKWAELGYKTIKRSEATETQVYNGKYVVIMWA